MKVYIILGNYLIGFGVFIGDFGVVFAKCAVFTIRADQN
jgi:hypothetical protein